jgi:uncharacterized membrane protein (UPF0136 family)
MLTKIFYLVFGALTFVGGIMGFLKGQSIESLVAGGISGVLLIVAGVLVASKPMPAHGIALVVSIVLIGFFGSSLAKSDPNATAEKLRARKGRAIPMLVLSSIGLVLSAAALIRK